MTLTKVIFISRASHEIEKVLESSPKSSPKKSKIPLSTSKYTMIETRIYKNAE